MKNSAVIKTQAKRVLRHALRFLFALVASFGVPQFFFPIKNVSKNFMYTASTIQYNVLCLALCAALFFASMSITASNDVDFAARWQARKPKASFASEMKFLLTDPIFLIKAGVFLLFTLLFPVSWLSLSLTELLGIGSGFVSKLPVVPAVLTVCLIMALVARGRAIRLFRDGYLPDTKKNTRTYLSMTVYIYSIIIAVAAFIIFLLPFLGAMLSALFRKSAARAAFTIGFFVLVFFAVLFPVLLLRRKRFLKELEAICRRGGYELTVRKTAYLSVFFLINKESFRVTVGSKSYSCMLITAHRKLLPIIIDSEGKCIFHHHLQMYGTDLFRLDIRRSIDYRSEDKRVIILSPPPHKLLCRELGKTVPIDSDGKVGDFKVFVFDTFLRSLERGVIDR